MTAYYWAGGRKVPLRESDQVVLDLESPVAAKAGPRLEALRAEGTPLNRSLLMVPRTAAGELTEDGLPVYRTDDGSLLAVLPEVRVEADPERLEAISRSVDGAHVAERTEERLVLVPDSGRGEDALTLANRIAESGGCEVSQARFVRVVRRPGPGPGPR